MFTWPGTNIICNTWLPIAKQHFISGAASEKTAVKLISESKMAASDYGFMVFRLKGDNELFVQTINWKGEIIYTAVIK